MAVPKDEELRQLLAKFVCVRMVQMWGVDLTRFQFDFSMTWSIFYMNADGTIYGRYGTRSAMREQSAREISVAGFKRSIAASLALHRRYANDPTSTRSEVAGKQTKTPPAWPQPQKIPTLAANEWMSKPFSAFAEERNKRAHGVGCIHCHMVQSGELMSLRKTGKAIAERLIWPYPMPYAVGLHMDHRQRSTVKRVVQGSAAATAGLQAGDEIVSLDGQTILSTADIQWVLHNAGEEETLVMTVNRDGATVEKSLRLAKGWRRRLGDWRFVNMNLCMQIAGFNGRPGRGGNRRLLIRVQRAHRKRLQGIDLQRNDHIVAIDGKRQPMNLGQLTAYLLSKEPGSKLRLAVKRRGRDGERQVELKLK